MFLGYLLHCQALQELTRSAVSGGLQNEKALQQKHLFGSASRSV